MDGLLENSIKVKGHAVFSTLNDRGLSGQQSWGQVRLLLCHISETVSSK